DAARAPGRVVALLSDHGHVWHRADADFRRAPDGGQRWRPATTPAGPGEVIFRGERVMDPRGVVVPRAERVRYGAQHQNGYHGGATPRVMLPPTCPLYRTSRPLPAGLAPCEYPAPGWWDEPAARAAGPPPPAPEPARPAPTDRGLYDDLPAPEP